MKTERINYKRIMQVAALAAWAYLAYDVGVLPTIALFVVMFLDNIDKNQP